MAVRRIVIYGDPILRRQTAPVEQITAETRELVDDMIDTMYEAEGIGLAAPQVGEPVAVCIVNMGLIHDDDSDPRAYINPEILAEEGTCTMEEGCLSIPDIREDVTRPEAVTVRYQDLEGQVHEERVDGLLARVLQHEIDHLNGVLFIDRISPIKRKLLSKKLKRLAAESQSYIPSTG